MADSEPRKPGWYPHRYGVEGMQSYWDGSEWTGESRPRRSPSFRLGRLAGWLILAIVLSSVGSVLDGGSALFWIVGAAATAAWVMVAVSAKGRLVRVLLWVWVVFQLFGWWAVLGPGATLVGEERTAALLADLGAEIETWGVSSDAWACVESRVVDAGYADGVSGLPVRSVLLSLDDPSSSDLPAVEQFWEGVFLFMFDPQEGCLTSDERLAVEAHLGGGPSPEASISVVEDFLAALSTALASRDTQYLLQHLHPTTFEFWTERECVSALESWPPEAPYPVTVGSITSIRRGALDYGSQRYATFDNGYRVQYTDQHGEPGQMHVSLDRGGPYWFTNCDAALSARVPPGADAELDRLWSECAAEDFESCDLLWLLGGSETGVRTDYEQFGGTCGGRAEYARAFCTDAFGSGPDPERWYSECAEGDFGSCDILAVLMPTLGSSNRSDREEELWQFGLTCGDRVAVEDTLSMGCLLELGETSGGD